MFEDHFLCAGMANTLDHGGVIRAIGKNNTARKFAAKSSKGGIVGNITGGENQRRFLCVKLRNGRLEVDGMLVMSRYIPCASSAGSVLIESFVHSLQDFWVSSHPEIIIRAPHGNPFVFGRHVCSRELLSKPIYVVEVAVGLILVLLIQLGVIKVFIVKRSNFRRGRLGTRNRCVFA